MPVGLEQLVAHLLDTDLVFAERIKRVIAEDAPVLQGFDENLWIERLGSAEMPVAEAADLFSLLWIGQGESLGLFGKRAAEGYAAGSGAVARSPKARMAATMDHYTVHLAEAPVIVLACLVR